MATEPTCAFCEIVAGRGAAHVVAEDDHTVAFLDRTPLFEGHTLVVPRLHVETLADLERSSIEPLFAVVQRWSALLPGTLGAEGTFVALNNRVSQSVPHLHVHVVPRRKGDGLRGFFWPRRRYRDDAHMAEVAGLLRVAWASERGGRAG